MLADDEPIYREFGRIVATASKANVEACADQYIALLMQAMKKRTTPKKHANVLMHIMGFFKESLAADDKTKLLGLMIVWVDRSRSASRKIFTCDCAAYVDSLF